MSSITGPNLRLDLPDDLIVSAFERARELGLLPEVAEPADEWFDAQCAADYLKCGKRRVYNLVSEGRIPVHREGARLLFKRSELDGCQGPRAERSRPPFIHGCIIAALTEQPIKGNAQAVRELRELGVLTPKTPQQKDGRALLDLLTRDQRTCIQAALQGQKVPHELALDAWVR